VIPRGATLASPHANKAVVTGRTGRPVTNRRQTAAAAPVEVTQRTKSPSQTKALGAGSPLGSVCSTRRNGGSPGIHACRCGCASRLPQVSSSQPNAPSGRRRARGSTNHALFFPALCRVGTGAPVFGPLPPYAQSGQGGADGLAGDAVRGEALLDADLGSQVQGPQTGGLAEGPRALVEQRAQPFGPGGIAGDVDRLRTRGAGRSRGQARRVEGMERLAGRLVVAASLAGHLGDALAAGTREEHLAPAQDKGLG
jgi:hypothetical protein